MLAGLHSNRLGLHSSGIIKVVMDRDVWRLSLELLPRNQGRRQKNFQGGGPIEKR